MSEVLAEPTNLQCVWSTPDCPIPPGTVLTALPPLEGSLRDAYDLVVALVWAYPHRGASHREIAVGLGCSSSAAHGWVAELRRLGYLTAGHAVGRSGNRAPNTIRPAVVPHRASA
jgi:hypothetical protein